MSEQEITLVPQASSEVVAAQEMLNQQQVQARAVAVRMGYQLPADSTDPDLIQRDIAANMRRSIEACLEVGRGLMVLKAACAHGNFLARLDVLGMDARVAQRFMQSATKFANAASTPLLKAAGNQTKLFEMLVLDDEQIEELQLTGQTGELSLDDVATMSVKELRANLRRERTERLAAEEQVKRKNSKIDELDRKLNTRKVAAFTDWPEAFKGYIEQAQKAKRDILLGIDALAVIRQESLQIESQSKDEDEVLGRAWIALAAEMQDIFAIAGGKLEAEARTFDNTLQAVADDHREGSK